MRLHPLTWLAMAGLVLGGTLAYQQRSEMRFWFQSKRFRLEGLDQALPSEAYLLETNRWLEFKISKDIPLARLVSNASIAPNRNMPTGTQWPYAIEYELRGSHRKLLSSGVYHLKAEQMVLQDKKLGKPIEVNTFLDRRFSPLSGRHWMLNLRDPSLTNVETLRLRLQSSAPDLLNVVMRIYFKSQVAEHKLGFVWKRLNDDEKKDLSRGNVYSFKDLTPQEKLNLVQYRWLVASPEGIPGHDFKRCILYVRDDTETMQVVRNWVPAGVAVDPDHWGTLPVTNVPGQCWVQMFDPATNAIAQAISNTFLWHSDLQQWIDTNRLSWSGTNQSVLLTNRNGLLEIHANSRLYARAFQVYSGVTNEITPEPVHLLSFTTSSTNSVVYDVDHVGDEPTLFRVELRRFKSSPTETNTGTLHYALLNQQGGTFQDGDVTLTNLFSPYDWLETTNGLTNITVAQTLCFVLPPAVKGVQVSSCGELLFVSAYSRPFNLVRKIQVPQDYLAFNALSPGQPSWYTVRPVDHIERREVGQASVLRVQAPLPEYDPLVMAGEYEWDSFLPDNDPVGSMLLIPSAPGPPLRADSLSFAYFPVPVGPKHRVCFLGSPWQPQVEPSMVLASTNSVPGAVAITLDGQCIFSNSLEAPVTCVRLGNLKAGEHELSVRAANPISAYLNYLESENAPAFLERFCLMASSNGVSLPYVKSQPGSEVLVLRVFSGPDAAGDKPFKVRLKLKQDVQRGVGPFTDLTFLEREAEVTASPVMQTCLVSARSALLDVGQPVFFPIGPDLPPGRYEVEVSVVAATSHWLSLSRTTPGLAEKLTFTQQRPVY